MEDILSQAKKVAEQAEVFHATTKTTPVRFEGNRLKQIHTKESTTTALRLIKNGRIGFAQVNGFAKPEKMVDMALETCTFGAEARFDFPGSQSYPAVQVLDPQVDRLAIEDMVQIGQQMIDTLLKHTPELVCEAAVSKGITSVHIANSQGNRAEYQKSFFNISLEGVLVRNDDMLFVGDSQSSCHPIRSPEIVVAEVTRQLELARINTDISPGPMPVVFTPLGVASALLSPLVAAFNGKTVLEGASPLKDKVGKQVFDKSFSLWDDATLPYQVASCPCDDEGVPGQRTPLVESGVISNFYYDLQTAALAGKKSTGNGTRAGGMPTPSPNSLVATPGNLSYKDMVKDIKEGLVIDFLMGAEQGNILNGDFSGNVLLGYKIERGEITGRVKNTMVSGNAFDVLKKLGGIGKDARWVGGFLYTPHLYCLELSVTTKNG
ncbi:MAG: TldD/PmbA family protein [Chloroflexi bacterium]|nr:TldD/PmbA family protein [Chloroflexota bacterium]MBM3165845.1 TldD/PmbA family protein [Chloroflexota bacterium]MBM4449293.1 TldD/PmbA family protein [Chloroflexota bacterium]